MECSHDPGARRRWVSRRACGRDGTRWDLEVSCTRYHRNFCCCSTFEARGTRGRSDTWHRTKMSSTLLRGRCWAAVASRSMDSRPRTPVWVPPGNCTWADKLVYPACRRKETVAVNRWSARVRPPDRLSIRIWSSDSWVSGDTAPENNSRRLARTSVRFPDR